MMMIKPVRNYILVEPIFSDKSAGGLVIPENSLNFPRGKVIGVPDPYEENGFQKKSELKLGQIVIYPTYAALSIDYQGTTLLFVKESELLGILNPQPESATLSEVKIG
jgi:chaperonin GroES